MSRDAAFGSLVVFVFAPDAAVYRNQSRMLPACLCQNIVQTNVIAFHPTAVQPKDIKASVVGHQLIQLVTGKGLIVFPPVGMAVFLVIDVTVGVAK